MTFCRLVKGTSPSGLFLVYGILVQQQKCCDADDDRTGAEPSDLESEITPVAGSAFLVLEVYAAMARAWGQGSRSEAVSSRECGRVGRP